MYNWGKWIWPGIVATALLTALALWFRTSPIEQDLTNRVTAIQEPGRWAKTAFDGRDGELTGVAPSAEAQAQALAQARDAYGVRVVRDASQVALAASPYKFSAIKDETGVVLTGNYPDFAVHDAIVADAQTRFPGIKTSDAMTLASGAPEGYAAASGFAMEQLSALVSGEALISGGALSVKGKAADLDAYESVTATLAGALPSGLTLGDIAIEPPAPDGDYVWSASKSEDGSIVLDGFAPSSAVRGQIAARAAELNPSASIINTMRIAGGAPDGFGEAALTSLDGLAKFTSGKASFDGSSMTVAGIDSVKLAAEAAAKKAADDAAAKKAAEDAAAKKAADDAAAKKAADEAAAKKAADEAAAKKAADEAAAKKTADEAAAKKAADEAAAKKAADDAAAKKAADDAAAKKAADDAAAKKAADEAAAKKAADEAAAKAAMPALGERAQACQTLFSQTLATGTINFRTGKAALDPSSDAILDRLAETANQCPDITVEIAGHTDSDGSAELNQKLSANRAKAVLDYLAGKGVNVLKMTARGYGAENPVAPNDTPENKAKNRRIEFSVSN